MKRVDCEHIEANLISYLEGEGDPALEPQISAHLESCLRCRERAESIRILNRLFETLPRKALPMEAGASMEEEFGMEEGGHVETVGFSPVAPLLAKLPGRGLPAGFEQRILEAVSRERARTLHPSSSGRRLRLLQSLAAAAAMLVVSVLGVKSLKSQPSYPKALNIQVSIDKSFYGYSLDKRRPALNRRDQDGTAPHESGSSRIKGGSDADGKGGGR